MAVAGALAVAVTLPAVVVVAALPVVAPAGAPVVVATTALSLHPEVAVVVTVLAVGSSTRCDGGGLWLFDGGDRLGDGGAGGGYIATTRSDSGRALTLAVRGSSSSGSGRYIRLNGLCSRGGLWLFAGGDRLGAGGGHIATTRSDSGYISLHGGSDRLKSRVGGLFAGGDSDRLGAGGGFSSSSSDSSSSSISNRLGLGLCHGLRLCCAFGLFGATRCSNSGNCGDRWLFHGGCCGCYRCWVCGS